MISMIRFIAFIVALASCWMPPLLGGTRDTSKMTTILAIGDSLTDGFGLSRSEAYPALIGEKMRAANYRFEVINAGVSGGTTAGALSRLPSLLHRKRIDIVGRAGREVRWASS